MPDIGIDLYGFATADKANSVGEGVISALQALGKVLNLKRGAGRLAARAIARPPIYCAGSGRIIRLRNSTTLPLLCCCSASSPCM